MSEIQRYFFDACGLSGEKAQLIIGEDPNAAYVLYSDHLACVAELEKERERLKGELEHAQLFLVHRQEVLKTSEAAAMTVIDSLKQQLAAMQWISVETEWPPEGEWVILGGGDAGVEQGYQQRGKEFYLTRTDSYDDVIQVFPTHWMPLPAPPKP